MKQKDGARGPALEGGGAPSSGGAAAPPSAGAAAALRGFGPVGILTMLVLLLTGSWEIAPMLYIPVGAVMVLIWARLTRTPWREIGYVRPRSWLATVSIGLTLGIALKLAMKAIVMPLLGADPVNHTYHFLSGNRALLPVAIYAMFNAGFAEETTCRGYFFERLRTLFGTSRGARIATVLLTSAWFAVGHYAQGVPGVEQAAIMGLVYGTIFAVTGSIWVPMILHAAFDLTALVLIYNDVEIRVAHWVFHG